MNDLYGLIGETLEHSLSPQIHRLIFHYTDVAGVYRLFEVSGQDIQNVVPGLKALGIKGVNVTIPYKTDMLKFLDTVSPEAARIGAINTIVIKEGLALGYNTDYQGFGMALDKYTVGVKGKIAVVLGTGGSSRAVAQYLLDAGIGEIIFVSRSGKRAKKGWYNNFNVVSYREFGGLIGGDLLVNCTPVGMYPGVDETPIEKRHLQKFDTIFDLIYNPSKTLLLKHGSELGLKSINGLYMLVAQAVAAQELWNEARIGKDTVDKVYSEINCQAGDRFTS